MDEPGTIKITELDMQNALVGFRSRIKKAAFNPFRQFVFRNYSGFHGHEADLMVFQPSKTVWEVEVKVSLGDLKREFIDKANKHSQILAGGNVSRFLIAVPSALVPAALSIAPDWVGIISVTFVEPKSPRCAEARTRCETIRPGRRIAGRKWDDADLLKAAKSVYYRSVR